MTAEIGHHRNVSIDERRVKKLLKGHHLSNMGDYSLPWIFLV